MPICIAEATVECVHALPDPCDPNLNMIEISHLSKDFAGFKAVDDISFSVGPGEVLGFLGPNGAGKSTTMKMIAGFLRPSGGYAKVMGYRVSRRPMRAKREIGYLPEGAPLYADMTPPDFLEFIASMRGIKRSHRPQAVTRVMRQLELEQVANKRIDALSKGFKRRVGIAQAIIHDPAVLILDEPTDGLDPNQKHQVRQLIRTLAKEKIIILSTHILEEVSAVCTRAIVIAEGQIRADDTPGVLQSRSRYHGAVTLDIKETGVIAAVTTALQQLDGVADVEVSEEIDGRLTVLPAADAELHSAVSGLAARHQWPVSALFVEAGRLDDVFRDITAPTAMADEVKTA